ncbi:hypothetical protein FSARC_174 [Fusarium sarcochroum]|uniref:Transcription factor domain-containing protein n=1 Tax=Fusarium sarcochroum TaxID=1208366 RepID=A0A8H4XGH0_9HYPO|nr:hypothetical protein FSARC_174 [Fusarium sarcochroum]
MQGIPRERDPRSRQACEPCRVARLSNATSKKGKKTSTLRDKFHQLESQVQNIYGLLQPAPNEGSESSSQAHAPEEESTTEPDGTQQDIFDADDVQIADQALPITPPFAPINFLALGLSLKAQIVHLPTQSEITGSYARCARDEVQDLASQGIATLQVVQSLCLLALRDILVCKPFQAQMTIGTASRLEACRLAVDDAIPQPIDVDLSLRCSWSVYILERTFSPRLCISDEEIPGPKFPQSAEIPPAPASTRHEEYPSDLYNPYNSNMDHGITAYYIRMISNWGHISLWLHHIRLAKAESPWLPESKYARLIARVYECDSQLPAAHLLRNVAFSKRSSAEVLRQREYWIPWVLMQVECHAYLSILNHPFIHLVAHTIDGALFHSGWVFHFLRLCDEHQLELHDPFIGNLVAAVATIPWLLQFVEDSRVSQKAANDVTWCCIYLSRISETWPHLYQKNVGSTLADGECS